MSEKKPRPVPLAGNVPMYELKVTLVGLPVWRRLLVRGDVNLGLLHAILQVAMGWTNSHLHQFTIGRGRYSAPESQDDMGFGEPELNENKALLMEVVPRAKTKFVYEYDFGDSWEHRIAVEKIHESEGAPLGVAICLDGAGACPPEDCGGIGGYADLSEIVKDPGHAEHASMLEWLGEGFDPGEFDLPNTNVFLKKLKFPRTTWQRLAKVLMERDGFSE